VRSRLLMPLSGLVVVTASARRDDQRNRCHKKQHIERIGDNTVDVGEQLAFVVSGEIREFTDASHPGGIAKS
jgi:phosphate transport system protein